MSSPDDIAAVLVGFSAIGFIVFFGVATFIPIVLDKTLLSKKSSAEELFDLLFHYPYRLITRLGETWSIAILIILSLLFVVSGLFGLIYLMTSFDILLTVAEFISISIMFLSIIFILYLSLCAIPTKEQDLRRLTNYIVGEKIKLRKKSR